MTNQVQGETLFAGASGITTPWMPVRGDKATFAVQVLANAGSLSLTWNIETRTRESTTATPVFSTDATATSSVSVDFSDNNALELVRYEFSVSGTKSAANFMVIRALQPSWQVDR